MKVKCISNEPDNCKEYSYLKNYFNLEKSYDRLIIGKEYVVYAITEMHEFIWYSLCDENYNYYPMWFPFSIFEITDQRLSRYWIFSLRERLSRTDTIVFSPFLAYSEWSLQDDYYDNLTDGEEREVKIFKKYKELMELEFPNPVIPEI